MRFALAQFVICIDNNNYQVSLELFKIYVALPDEKAEKYNLIRVLDKSGEDYLYPINMFARVKLLDESAQNLTS